MTRNYFGKPYTIEQVRELLKNSDYIYFTINNPYGLEITGDTNKTDISIEEDKPFYTFTLTLQDSAITFTTENKFFFDSDSDILSIANQQEDICLQLCF